MSNFKNNFSNLLLLSNQNIKFWDSEVEFEVVPIKLKDLLFNESLSYLVSILDTELEQIQKNIKAIELKSHYDFIHLILSLKDKRGEGEKQMGDSILKGLKTFIPDISFKSGSLQIKEIFVDSKLFQQIIEVMFKSIGRNRTVIYEDDDEFTRMEKKAILRAERIRKNAKKEKEGNSTFEDSLIALVYEYPQYKIEDLFELNVFTFNYLFKYVGKIANYEVSKIAAGNGLAKKHKYFIEK